MASKNRARTSNDDDLDSNESSDEDGCDLATTVRSLSTSLLTSNQQRIICSQPIETTQSNNADQSNINQQICGYPYVHYNVLYRPNHYSVQLGHSDPSNENLLLPYIFGSNQNYLLAEHIDYPTNERVRWMDDYQFSLTIEEYFTYFRESESIENTQAHRMPPIIVLNNIDRNQFAIDETDRINMNVITQNNPAEIAAPLRPIDIPAETTVTRAPDEIPQDTDFSVITSETQNIHEISTNNDDDDEQNLIPDSFVNVEDNEELIYTNNQIVEVSSNNASIADVVPINTSSNQMNNIDEQSTGTELTNNTLSPETSEITRDVAIDEATSQAILSITDMPVRSLSKLPTAIQSSNGSNKEIRS
ncbi:unnamed protein product [Rotaria sordida]|uniref:Uncharacterized protein n=2 Tax=Rotaria sordida TaxID=392033 RepID=A0A814LAU6_9BILA|nr:unnamed protein product [Rotaria sordida]CAF1234870.1 unnamed protein product [Rotaria sordida]